MSCKAVLNSISDSIIAVSTVVVMIVTGKVAQFMMESAEKKRRMIK